METKKNDSIKQIADNRAARYEYHILERHEAGIELYGTEVKSLRAGNVTLKEAWIEIKDGEAFVVSMHVSPYEKGNIFNRDPLRRRRLLMHKREITKLYAEVKQGGLTLIPLSLYLKGSRVKVQVGLCKGKKLYDKRESIAKRDTERRAKRETGKNLR